NVAEEVAGDEAGDKAPVDRAVLPKAEVVGRNTPHKVAEAVVNQFANRCGECPHVGLDLLPEGFKELANVGREVLEARERAVNLPTKFRVQGVDNRAQGGTEQTAEDFEREFGILRKEVVERPRQVEHERLHVLDLI